MSSTDRDDGSIFDGLLEEDERDKAKRVSRNKSEKKRREQFNVLIGELGTLLPASARRADKSSVLQKCIDHLRRHEELAEQSESSEIRRDWKPPFLSNEEFTQLMLEALDGFFLVILTDGNIVYVSESVASLLGHLPSDLVDQNLLSFLPVGEHADVYKALSSHPEGENLSPEYLRTKGQLEFCCHLLRGSVDPKEPPVYEYVRFIGHFKSLSNMPRITRNGLEEVLQRSLRPAFDDHVCFVATVRLAVPQFIRELCVVVEEPSDEFTSRHSLEWKFLLLDHRAPPIIGYLPFEVLGTSGYDYYHADDLESLAKCHEHLMQFGKGKSCCYRFLTKGQQWIWLRTHYYITYHQWNSRPEFIVCTHTVLRYAEVRAAQRKELGVDSSPEPPVDESGDSGPKSPPNASSLKGALERLDDGRRTPSVSSRGSRGSSLTSARELRNPTPTKPQADASSPARPAPADPGSRRRPSDGAQSTDPQSPIQKPAPAQVPRQQPTQAGAQLDVMQHLKEQLEQRTQMIEANIKKQREELRQIHQQLQRVQDQGLEMFRQQSSAGGKAQPPQGSQASSSASGTSHILGPVYNTVMVSHAGASVVQIPSTMVNNVRFPGGQQLVTKLVTAPMACSTVVVPSTVLVGPVVTAYNPYVRRQGRTQDQGAQGQQQGAAQSQAQEQTRQ
ncbi:clock circadian regulator b isoform X2 [Trichomycterus rosablanca]|uniref:clock circadian regulator b isoform X2 n=1 Tax=Trichomycterus rosablanca TaxID=2290929 RepID=UPI002F35205C